MYMYVLSDPRKRKSFFFGLNLQSKHFNVLTVRLQPLNTLYVLNWCVNRKQLHIWIVTHVKFYLKITFPNTLLVLSRINHVLPYLFSKLCKKIFEERKTYLFFA